MQAQDAARTRLITGAVAIAVTLATAWSVGAGDGRLAPVTRGLAVGAVAMAVIGVVAGWPSFGVLAALLLGSAFTATRVGEPSVLDGRTVPLAATLLVIAELVAWAAEARTARLPGAGPALRLQRLVTAVAAGAIAATVVAAVVTLPASSDLAVAALGVAAVAAAVAILTGLVRARSLSSRT